MANIDVYDNEQHLAEAAANLFVEQAAAADGQFTVSLTGGSTPLPFYRLLATDKYASQVDWNKVQVFFGDERAVPPNHDDSNYAAAQSALLSHVPLPLENVHRMKGELDAEEAAKEYGELLRDFFDGGPPAFDLHIIGMGDDGHTQSLFPHVTDALYEDEHRVIATRHPNHPHPRITMTAWATNTAKLIVALVSGAEKADVLRDVLEGDHQPEVYPVQLIQPADGEMRWMIDQAAAAKLSEA